MILRFYLRLILIPTILFTAVLLIIRTQPYDDHELREPMLLLYKDYQRPTPTYQGQ